MSINPPETPAQLHIRLAWESTKLVVDHMQGHLPVVLPTDLVTVACMLIAAVADASGDRTGVLKLVSDAILATPSMELTNAEIE